MPFPKLAWVRRNAPQAINQIIQWIGTALVAGIQGGNARGYAALDISTERISSSQVPSGSRAITIGTSNLASAAQAIAIGNQADSTGQSAVAIGDNPTASGTESVAIGTQSNATATSTIAIGDADATGTNAIAIGRLAQALHANSVAIGRGTTTAANQAIVGANVMKLEKAGDHYQVLDSNMSDAAAAAVATLLNAPTAGNPTKWIAIDDNGTTRYLPLW